MQVEQVRFDSVFDVQARAGLFSFKAGGRPHYGVVLPGRTIPREGARYKVVMAQAGNWHSVLGWRDLDSGRVTLHESVAGIAWRMIESTWCYALPVLAIGLWISGPWGALGGLLLGAGALAFKGRRALKRHRAVCRALHATTPAAG